MPLSIAKKDLITVSCHVLFVMIFILTLTDLIRFSITQMFIIAYIYTGLFVITILRSHRIKSFSAGMMVVYYSFLEGAGMPIARLFAPEYTLAQINRRINFYGQYFDKYISLTFMSVSLMLLGMMVFGNAEPINGYVETESSSIKLHKKLYFRIGFCCLAFFSGYMVINLLLGNIVFGDYGAYKQWSGTRIRNYSQIAFWISSVFICACGNKKQIFYSLIVFAFPAVILLLSGNRNDVFFPALIGAGLYYTRFKKIPRFVFIAGFVVVFLFGPLIIQLRIGNDVSLVGAFQNVTQSIGSAFFELGCELHAVSNMFLWLDEGESYACGATIFLGFFASLVGLFFPKLRNYYEASRFYIANRIPSLGFTMSAEIFFNFGVVGTLLFFLGLGSIVGKMERKVTNLNRLIWYGFIMLWLLILVRNSFGYSLVYLKVFVLLLLIERLFYSLLKKHC